MAQIAAEQAEAAATPTGANPAPLGLAAFALTTFVLSALNAGWYTLGANAAPAVIGLALFYGGLGQLLAGMWEFRAGNTFGAAAFSSYGAFWLAVGWGLQNGQIRLGTPEIGFYFLAWGIFTFLWLLGTLRTNAALIGVFLFLTLTFIVLAVANFMGSGGSTWTTIGGYLGIITAILAWYTAAAFMLASTRSPVQLPTFPMG
jgi:succinate-acetate transporter protein